MKRPAEIISPTVDFRKGVCAICRKSVVNRWCDFITDYENNTMFLRERHKFNEINRPGAKYQTCDLPMCETCAFNVSFEVDMCPQHFALLQQVELTDEYQRKRRQMERAKINLEIMFE